MKYQTTTRLLPFLLLIGCGSDNSAEMPHANETTTTESPTPAPDGHNCSADKKISIEATYTSLNFTDGNHFPLRIEFDGDCTFKVLNDDGTDCANGTYEIGAALDYTITLEEPPLHPGESPCLPVNQTCTYRIFTGSPKEIDISSCH